MDSRFNFRGSGKQGTCFQICLKQLRKALEIQGAIFDFALFWTAVIPYRKVARVEADNVTAWKYPVVVALTDKGNITIGCPNERIAETLFGKGGLTNLFQKLGEGWGGRGSVGGSPRGAIMTTNDLSRICDILSSYF